MFRTIFVAEPSHDVSALKEYTHDIRFITTGYESIDNVHDAIVKNLQEFDPDQDALVPIGKVITSLMIGATLSKRFNGLPITVGVYKDKAYTFCKLAGA